MNIDPRIREQEFGNIQGDDFMAFRTEQQKVGRFYYRFPTGESGADVWDRTKYGNFDIIRALKWSTSVPDAQHDATRAVCQTLAWSDEPVSRTGAQQSTEAAPRHHIRAL